MEKRLLLAAAFVCSILAAGPAFATGGCFNPISFGADPTGVNDSYQAIRDAVDAAVVSDPSGEVCIADGTYRIANTHSGTLFPLVSNVMIRGEGRDITTIFYDGTPPAATEVFVISAQKSATIRELAIVGPSAPSTPMFRAVRHAGTSGAVRLESVRIDGSYDGLKTDPGDLMEVTIRNSELANIDNHGYLGSQASGTPTEGNLVSIENNFFHDIGVNGLQHALYVGMPVKKLVVHNNTFEDVTGSCVTNNGGQEVASGPVIYSNNRFRNCGTSSGSGIVFTPYNNTQYRALITGNDFRDMQYCVNLYYGNATITGNTFRNCTATAITGQNANTLAGATVGATDVNVTGNYFHGAYGIALLSSYVKRWTISSNNFVQSTYGTAPITIGDAIDDGVSDVTVTGNTFNLNGTAGLKLGYSATRFSVVANNFTGSSNGVGGVWATSTSASPIACYVAGNSFSQLDANYRFDVPGGVVGWNDFVSSTDSGTSPPALHPGFVSGTIASSGAITISRGLSVYRVTGATNISTINIPGGSGWQGPLILIFDGALTVNDGAGNLKLNGNFATTADDTLVLVYSGTSWVEVSRSVN
jgi:hypothetical protein